MSTRPTSPRVGSGRPPARYSARGRIQRVSPRSPNIVFADVLDLVKAVTASAFGIFRNAGQVCVAGSRPRGHDLRMPSSRRCRRSPSGCAGDPLNLQTEISVAPADQLRDLAYVTRRGPKARGVSPAAAGSSMTPAAIYMAPTVFADAAPSMTLAQEEALPVVAVMRFLVGGGGRRHRERHCLRSPSASSTSNSAFAPIA
ncbi:MAG: aldehyde dehydrogenase family protein [Vicinamibacterales bacterium]